LGEPVVLTGKRVVNRKKRPTAAGIVRMLIKARGKKKKGLEGSVLLRVFAARTRFSAPKRGPECGQYPWLPLTP